MSDQHVEVTEQGWLSRIKESFKGIITGLLLVAIAAPLLFWNEGRAVKRARDLETGKGAVVSAKADKISASNEGKLVHVVGDAVAKKPLKDEVFGVTAPVLILKREVEMYQWEETKKKKSKKKAGGKKVSETTYSYEKIWSKEKIKSGDFNISKGHKNPSELPYEAQIHTAKTTVGAYTLAPSGVAKISGRTALELKKDHKLPEELKKTYGFARIAKNKIYLNGRAKGPKVGDVRISYTVVKPQVVTVIAAQQGSSLVPYASKKLTGKLELVSAGKKTPEAMFESAASDNATMTWVLRLVGIMLNFIGLAMLLRPLSVLADVLPLAGDIVEAGTHLIAAVGGVTLSALAISLGWVFYRPLIGIPLLLLALGGIVMLVMKLRLARAKRSLSTPITA